MASIVRRESKSGPTFRIQVKIKDKGSGKTITHSTTWKPAPGMSEKQMQREAIIFADQYEAQMRAASLSATGEQFMSAESSLREYAVWWLERRKDEISATYYINCKNSIDDIVENIGAYKLRELNPSIIQRYYDAIDRRERTVVTVTPLPEAIRQRMEETGKNYKYLRYDAKVCSNTISIALNGGNVSMEFAETLARELETDVKTLFVIKKENVKYAFETNHKIKRTLRVILATAKKQRIIADNYASADFINFPKRPPREIDYMTDEDAKLFYAAAEALADIKVKTAAEILLLTGSRRGELCGLEWDDIDFEAETITINRSVVTLKGQAPLTKEPKTHSSNRVIGISGHLLQVLREYKAWYDQYREDIGDKWIDSNRLFIKEFGDPVYPSTVEFWVDKVCKAAGLPHRTVHSLRHTNITMQIAAGVPLVTVAGRAGHARTSTTTDIYSHFLKSSDKTASRILESIFEPEIENKQK